MSGKPRRRVTVENTKQVPEVADSKRKPSVFERLGPGAPPRNYDQPATTNPERYEKGKGCISWMKTGVCNYGKTCRYQHPPRREHNTEDLRHKVGRRRDTTQSEDSPDDSDSDSDRKSREHVRKRASRSHEKEGKMRSTVVLTKKRNVPDVSDSGSEPWQSAPSGDEPGFESELELEKQRQALQRELRTLQEAEAEESRLDNIFIQRETQSSSDSDSSSDGSPPPPQKKDKQRGRMTQPEEQQHRKKLTPKEKRRKARGSVSKTRQVRPTSSPEAGDRERSRARRGEEHSTKQRAPREPSSDDGDDQSPEPQPRPSKERRRRSISEQRPRKRSPSSSDERQKSPVEQRRKKLAPVEHHKRSPERKRKVSQPPPRERLQQQHKEKERERERERLEKEREKEREKELREREREKEQEMREREKARGREKERHEAPRRVAAKKSPPAPPEKVRSRKVVTPDISPRPEKRQRQESPEYERKRPQKRSETPDARPTRDHQGQSREHQAPMRESRRVAPEPEPKGKRAFSPRDGSASRIAKRHASPVDYKRSRSPESQKVRTPDTPAKARRGRVEDREGRARTQVSPSDSHRSGSRHNSPDPRTQPNRHVTPEVRTRRDQRVEREGREVRDQREGREGREGRDIKEGARGSHHDQRDTREPKLARDVREVRGNKDKDMHEREPRDQREIREEREPRTMRERPEPRGDMRPAKERDPRDHEPDIRETKEMQRQSRERKQLRQAPIENAINKRLAQLAQSSTDEALAEPVIPVGRRKRGGGAGGGGPPQRQEPRPRHPEESREPPARRGAGRHAAPAEFDSPPVKAAPQPVPRAERRGRKDISPEQRQAPNRTVTPEPKRGAKERRPAERVPGGERGRLPVASPEPPPRDREPRNVRGMRDKEGRERDDSRGSRERVERTELEGRAPRDMKEREPRAREMKEVHDERDLIDRGNRSADRSVDRGVDRNLDRSLERGMDRSMERNTDRNMDRGHGPMNRALSPLMGRGGFEKSRSPPAPRRRLTPEPARGRHLSPEDMRSQGHLPGHSPYHDEYDTPMIHPDHLSPADMLPEEFDHGRGRMGRNDRFSGGHRMPEERFDRSLERDRGDRFEHPPVDDRRFRGRDQYEHEPGFIDRNLMPRDMDDDFITTERDDLWSGENQWANNRGRPEQPSRRGVRGRGREDPGRSRRGRGRGEGRRGEEPFPFGDDQYLEDTPLPQDRWQMWDDQPHPDDCLPDNRQGGGRRMHIRHGGRGQERPVNMDRHGGRMFVDEMSDEQTRHKRSYIDDLTPPPKRRELSPSGSQQSGNRGSLGRDMRGDMMLMDGLEPRDGRDMMPHNLRGGSHDRVGPMRDREGRDMRDAREPRDLRDVRDMRDARDMREPRDAREPRDPREPRDNWDARDPRDMRDLRDVREPHDLMDPRDGRDLRDNRETRDVRDPKDVRDLREPRDAREPRDMREPREVREPREARDMRDTRDQREPREGREVKDVRDPKEPREPRDARSREGRGPRDRGREGAGSDRGGPEPEELMPRDRREKRIDPEADLPPTTKRPRSASPSPAGRGRKRQRGPPEKPAAERRGDKPWPDEPKRTPTKEGSLPRPTDSPAERRPGREHEDSASHGAIEKAAFSDWSDDGEMFGPHNKVEEDVDPPPPGLAGRGPGYHEGAERAHRSPSRSSIGSRHSHREDRPSGYRSDDMRRGSVPAPGAIQDSWSDGEHGPAEWTRGPGAGGPGGGPGVPGPAHRMPSFQGEPHSPLDVASTPPWERSNRRRNRGGSEVPERERPPPPPPGSFGEAEAAVRAHYRNGEEPPPAAAQAAPSPAAATAPVAKAEGEPRTLVTNKKKTKSSDKAGRNGEKLYDDISDDDLDDLIENVETEVEEKKKTGVSDVMDIDWACLVKESQQQVQAPPTVGVSALSRFSPANVFAQIGVSRAYAGEALFTRLKHVCQRQIDKEAHTDDQDEAAGEQPATTEPAPRFDILNDVAGLHDYEQRRRRERATVLQRIGPFRRALCARRDLILRRYLCRLDQESDVSGIFATPIIDQDLYRQSLQFLRQGSSERKFSALQEAEPMSL